jgi:hypothetical protein
LQIANCKFDERTAVVPQGFLIKGETTVDAPKTVADLCRAHGIDVGQLAAKSGLEEGRVTAILLGRWTPSPAERAAVSTVFGLAPDQIVWGHATPIQHIYGSGPG